MARPKNLQELLLQAAARWSDQAAFRHILGTRVRELKYRHLAEISYRCAQTLWARGMRHGDYALIWAPNSPDWVTTALAVLRLGGVMVPCDLTSSTEQILGLAKQLGRPIVLAGNKQYLQLADRLPAAQLVCISDCSSLAARTNETTVIQEANAESARPLLYSSSGSDPAVLAFTAGARGPAKGVILTHDNIVSNILAAERALGVESNDKVVTTLPFSHMVGFTAGLAIPFRQGATVVFGRTATAAELKEMLRLDGISAVVGTPDVFESLLNELEAEAERLPRVEQLFLALSRRFAHLGSSLEPALAVAKLIARFQPQLAAVLSVHELICLAQPRMASHVLKKVRRALGGNVRSFISGDLPAPAHLISSVESFCIPFVNIYGLTEASPVVAIRSPFVQKTTAVGRPISGVEIKIDSTGGAPGEILIKGRSVAEHYWNERSAAIENGWMRTGDSGYLDQEGQLHLTGPVRQPITVASGQEIDPAEIEEALRSRPAILEAYVFKKKSQTTEGPCAAIVASTIARSKPDLKERISLEVNEALASLPEHKRLSDYQIWESEFPRTATGKLRRGEIASAYAGKRKTQTRGTAGNDDLVSDGESLTVSKMIAEVMDPEVLRAISPSGSHDFAPSLRVVNDLGLDSLARVELACRLSKQLSAEVSEEMVEEACTVEDLIVLVKGLKKQDAAEVHSGSRRRDRWSEQPWPVKHYGTLDWPGLEDPFVVAARRTFGVVLKTTAAIFNELETAGADRLVIDPPYIVAANHASRLDTLALMACFPVNLLRLVHPVEAADELFADPVPAAAAAYLLNAVSYERHGSLKSTLSKCEALLKAGRILVVFPEGGPSHSDQSRPFAPVAAHLAISTGCPIIPAFIDGTGDVLKEERAVPSPAPVKITFGLPLYPPLPGSDLNACRDLTRRLQLAIESLKPTSQAVSAGKSR